MKRPDGITLISIYHWAVAVLCLLSLCFVMAVPFLLAIAAIGERQAAAGVVVAFILTALGALFLLLATAAYALVGWGLWLLKPWARIGATVLAILSMITCVPLGTVLGAVIVWYLFQPAAKAAFEAPEAASG